MLTIKTVVSNRLENSASFATHQLNDQEDAVSNNTLCSRGEIHFSEIQIADSDIAEVDIAEVKARCADHITQAELYDDLAKKRLNYGDAFKAVDTIWFGHDECIAALRWPESVPATQHMFRLHPSLLDGAFQSAYGVLSVAMSHDSAPYVPVSAQRLTVYDAVNEGVLFAYVRMSKSAAGKTAADRIKALDIYVLDQHGNVKVAIEQLLFVQYASPDDPSRRKKTLPEVAATQAQDTSAATKPSGHHFTTEWQSQPLSNTSSTMLKGSLSESAVLLINAKPSLQKTLEAAAQTLISVGATQLEYDVLLPQLLSSGSKNIKIVIFDIDENSHINGVLPNSFTMVNALIQAVLSYKPSQSIEFVYVYQDKQTPLCAQKGAITELLNTLSLENSRCQFKVLSVYDAQAHFPSDTFNQHFVSEFYDSLNPNSEIRYLPNGQRLVKTYQVKSANDLAQLNQGAGKFVQHGMYLITGGLGAIGAQIAAYLCTQYQATVFLLGRSELNDEKQATLDNLNQNGKAYYVRADISKQSELSVALRDIKKNYGQLNGILHCAGVANVALFNDKTTAQAEQVLTPKVIGTINLDQLTCNERLDLFVTFSSISSAAGYEGLADYAYANGFMDRYMADRRDWVKCQARFGSSVSVNWPYWADGGMAIEQQTQQWMESIFGVSAIASEDALAVLELALRSDTAQWVVMPGDLTKISRSLQRRSGQLSSVVEHITSDPLNSYGSNSSDLNSSDLSKDEQLGLTVQLKQSLIQSVANILKLSEDIIETDKELDDYGFDSVTLAEFATLINSAWHTDITPAVFYEFHTIDDLTQHLLDKYASLLVKTNTELGSTNIPQADVVESDPAIFSNKASAALSAKSSVLATTSKVSDTVPEVEPVAIVGMHATLPNSSNLDEFWQHLLAGDNLITEIPKERWGWQDYYGDPTTDGRLSNSKWGGFIQNVDKFDPLFFGISPPEATVMDPQHRLFLQSVWHCIEDAGYAPSSLSGRDVGVFAGMQFQDYQALIDQSNMPLSAHVATGNAHSMLPNRVSYLLNLNGPSEAIDTACSSALVAVHRAVQAIQYGEAECAIAGGVSLSLSPLSNLLAGQMGALSADGQCKTFDETANGYVKGEGLGTFFLKTLSQAEQDGDAIYAVIKSTQVNHGGKAKSLTAPNPGAQAKLLIKAYQKAGINPATVGLIETHGTGTELGDPIEVEGLKQAFTELYQQHQLPPTTQAHCAIGSVKTNIGHLEPAAGVAGITKVLLSMRYKTIVPSINLQQQNPYIRLDNSPFYIATEAQPWSTINDQQGIEQPRIAGVSSFGFGGANAHIVLEEYVADEYKATVRQPGPYLLPLSAKNAEQLPLMAAQLYDYLELHANELDKQMTLTNIAYTLQAGRDHFQYRAVCISDSLEEFKTQLQALAKQQTHSSVLRTEVIQKQAVTDEHLVQIENYITQNNQYAIAALWLSGVELDWTLLYKKQAPRKVHLPGYVFIKKAYWINANGVKYRPEKYATTNSVAVAISTTMLKTSENSVARDVVNKVIDKTTVDELPRSTNQTDLVFYQPQWDQTPLNQSAQKARQRTLGPMLIFEHDTALSTELSENNSAEKVISAVDIYTQWQDGTLGDSDACKQAIHQLIQSSMFASTDTLCIVISLSNIKYNNKKTHQQDFIEAVELSSILYQAILEYPFTKLHLIFCYQHRTGQHQPHHAALPSFLRSLQLEDDRVKGKAIEFVYDKQSSATVCEIANILLSEISDSDKASNQTCAVRYTEQERWTIGTSPITTPQTTQHGVGLVQKGCYLITGGLGAIGQVFARFLAKEYHAKLILVGRSADNEETQACVAQLNQLGASVHYYQCDIAKRKDVNALMKYIANEKLELNGILHCAGALHDCLVRNKERHIMDEIVAAKVYGTLHLDEATKSMPLDFFMVCSSLSAIKGNLGQSVYAYANGFMDHYTEVREYWRTQGLRQGHCVAINWPLWEADGMSVAEELLANVVAAQGHRLLNQEEGVNTFLFALNNQIKQLFPAIQDSVIDKQTIPEKPAETEQQQVETVLHGDIEASMQAYLTDLFFQLLEVELTPESPFEQSGLDSFLSIQALNKLEQEFGDLRKTLLFEHYTIKQLSEYLLKEHRVKASALLIAELASEPVESVLSQSTNEPEQSTVIEKNVDKSDDAFDYRFQLQAYLVQLFNDIIQVELTNDAPFEQSGVDSFMSIQALNRLEQDFGSLRKTLLFEHYTITQLSDYFLDQHQDSVSELFAHVDKVDVDFEAVVEVTTPPINKPIKLDLSDVTVIAQQTLDIAAGSYSKEPLSEELIDKTLVDKIRRLTAQYANECTVSQASYYLSPELFIVDSIDAYFHICRYQTLLLVCGYTGDEKDYAQLTSYADAYCKAEQLSLNVLTECSQPLIDELKFTATPFGAMQRITNLQEYTTNGSKFRRLRNAVSRFTKQGDCRLEEYVVGDCATTDAAILEVIDLWSDKKQFVNPYIKVFTQKIRDCSLAKGCRVFNTYLNDSLQNVIFITQIGQGYFMDLEFYPASMPYGGLEFSIMQIVEKLQQEGCQLFSLGATFGIEHGAIENSDSDVLNTLRDMREVSKAGAGNFQFKNKFRVTNTPLYLCKPKGGRAHDVADIYAVISGMQQPDLVVENTPKLTEPSTNRTTQAALHDIKKHSVKSTSVPSLKLQSTLSQRTRLLEEYDLNPMRLPAQDVPHDLMTDSWGQLSNQDYVVSFVDTLIREMNDTSPNSAESVTDLLQTMLGFDHVITTNGGRTAERVFCEALAEYEKDRRTVLQTMLFPTWLFSELHCGFKPQELPMDSAVSLDVSEVFRGNIDVEALAKVLQTQGEQVAFICIELSNNAAGGYPVSMANLKAVKKMAGDYGVLLGLDITRIIENVLLIQQYEEGYQTQDVWALVHDICQQADWVTGSLGKDFSIPGGGFVGVNDQQLADKIKHFKMSADCVLENGIEQVASLSLQNRLSIEQRVKARVQQVSEMHAQLLQQGVPLLAPAGTHCLVMNLNLVPHFADMSNAQASFVAWLYIQTGIRAGAHSAGMQKDTPLNNLVRLAIPVGLSQEQANDITQKLIEVFHQLDSFFALDVVEKGQGFGDLDTRYAYTPAQSDASKTKSTQISSNEASELLNGQETVANETQFDGVAIVGVAGKYPGAEDLHAFWQNLTNGVDSVDLCPDTRKAYALNIKQDDMRFGGYIDGVDEFDAEFFYISEEQAALMDPQERLFMQTAWHALEDAAYTPTTLCDTIGSKEVGVYAGVVWSQYQLLAAEQTVLGNSVTTNPFHFSVANRVSHFMDFCGPSFAVDSACSSSFTALNLAFNALKQGEIRAALVGGVNLDLHVSKHQGLKNSEMLSPTGKCHSFSQHADGYVPGEGCGVVVLKSLSDAIRDRDHVYGVIKDVSISHTGKGSGYSIPSPKAQAQLIKASLKRAQVTPEKISYVEGHGTGTGLGDSIEMISLTEALGRNNTEQKLDDCALGSVKSNIGHLEAAAGLASLTKVLLQMKHQQIVPSLHAEQTNNTIDLGAVGLSIPKSMQNWSSTQQPLVASVNCFAAGGTNAHMVIEQFVDDQMLSTKSDFKHPVIVPLSANSTQQLQQYAANLANFLSHNEIRLLDFAYSLQVGRVALSERYYIVANDHQECLEKLHALANPKDLSALTADNVNEVAIQAIYQADKTPIDHAYLTQLGDSWLGGAELAWDLLYGSLKARRMGLPVYPFCKNTHWIEIITNSEEAEKTTNTQEINNVEFG